MIESGLFAFLSGNAAINTLCSDRIYPVILPQAPALPCVTYRIEGEQRSKNLSEGQESFVGATLMLDAWGETYKTAKALSEALRSELMNYQGLMGSVNVNQVFIDSPIDVYEDRVELHRSSRVFTIWYREV